MKNYDLLVVGGGMAGITAAACAAEEGLSVLLLERRNTLAWELTNCRLIYDELAGSEAAETLKDSLASFGGYKKGCMDPIQAGRLLTARLREEGVEILLGVMPSELLYDGEVLTGVVCATEAGELAVHGRLIIDATHSGFLFFDRFMSPYNVIHQKEYRYALLFAGVAGGPPLRITEGLPNPVNSVELRDTLYPGEVQADIIFTSGEGGLTPWACERTFTACLPYLVELLQRRPIIAAGRLRATTCEPWYLPHWVLAEEVTEGPTSVGLLHTGAYTPSFRESMFGLALISALLKSGEEAARKAVAQT